MPRSPLDPALLAELASVDTPTTCNAIETFITLPPRTIVEEIALSPMVARDLSADLAVARDLGEPSAAP